MKWRTAISTHKDGELYVRGISLSDLARKLTFTEAVFFIIKGIMPKKQEVKMLDALLVSMIEHGVEAPSSFVARSVISTGNPVNSALAAGILAVGEWHGGAVGKAAFYLQSKDKPQEIVSRLLKNKERVPGFGHKVYKTEDPRATFLFKKAKELEFSGKYIKRALTIQKELARQSGKTLPINVDGAAAAIISELGFDWRLGKSVFVLGRLPGLIAHIQEEIKNEKPYRRLEEKDVEYIGPKPKS